MVLAISSWYQQQLGKHLTILQYQSKGKQMKQTVYRNDFHDAFNRMDRGSQFSYEALNLLFDYFEEVDEDMELDVIAICCEYSEMTLDEVHNQYPTLFEDLEDNEKPTLEYAIECLENETTVIGQTDDSIVFVQF